MLDLTAQLVYACLVMTSQDCEMSRDFLLRGPVISLSRYPPVNHSKKRAHKDAKKGEVEVYENLTICN